MNDFAQDQEPLTTQRQDHLCNPYPFYQSHQVKIGDFWYQS